MKIYLFFIENANKCERKHFRRRAKTLSPCHVPSSELTKMFVSQILTGTPGWDFLIEKTPVSLDLKQIFKIRSVKQGFVINIHVHSSGFSIFLAIIPESQSLAHNTLEHQLCPGIKSPLLKLWHSYTHQTGSRGLKARQPCQALH